MLREGNRMKLLVLSAFKQVLCFLSVLTCASNHVYTYCVSVHVCLLGAPVQPHSQLDLETRGCGSLASVGVPHLAASNS